MKKEIDAEIAQGIDSDNQTNRTKNEKKNLVNTTK